MDQVKRVSVLAVFAALLLGGCGSSDAVPGHSAAEEKAIADQKNMTPEQKIEQIKTSPMPEGAKAAMIERIKRENGIQ